MGLSSFIARFLYLVGISSSASIPNTGKEWEEQLGRIKGAITLGIVLQFVVLPMVGWSVVKVLLHPDDFVTPTCILHAVTSPGHAFSLLWCSMFNADLFLSMVMTGFTNLGIAFLPALIWLLVSIGLYKPRTIWTCIWFPLVFIFLGMYWRDVSMFYMVPDLGTMHRQLSGKAMMNTLWIGVGFVGSMITSTVNSDGLPIHSKQLAHFVGILASVYFVDDYVGIYTSYIIPVPTFWSNKEPWRGSIWALEPATHLCIFLVVLLRMLITIAFVSATNLKRPEKVAFVIQLCWQNALLAENSAVAAFGGTGRFVGIPAFYGFCQMVTLAIFCWSCWKVGWTKAPSHEPFSKMIWVTYEIEQRIPWRTSN